MGADFSNGLLAFYDFENNFDSSTGNYNLTSSGTTNFGSGVDGTGHKSANFGGSNLLFNTSLDAFSIIKNLQYLFGSQVLPLLVLMIRVTKLLAPII